MRKLCYILLILCLCPSLVRAQRRFSAAERWEYSLAGMTGFTNKEVSSKTDVLSGLHASQYTGSHHLLGMSLEGGWSSFVSPMPTARITPGGGSIGFHIIYEYQYSGFLVQAGIGINYQRVSTSIADTAIYHPGLVGTWQSVTPRTFTLRHQFQERTDMAQQLYGQIPVYVGHYILSPIGIGYFLAGVHFNYAFWGNTTQKMHGTTTALYDDLVGVWGQMANHGLRYQVPIERKGDALKLKLDVMAHVEMGYEYTTLQNPHSYRIMPNDRLDCRLRFGAFVDFGILNICPNTQNVYYGIPDATLYDFPTYRMDHVFSTKDAAQYWLRNLYIGFRFTVLFGFPGKERCILCDPWRH